MNTEEPNELSKPVAWASERHIETRCRIDAFTDEESANGAGWGKVAQLYSQEYVSALLAELEAKDKRIAELEEQKAMWVSVAKELGSKCDALEAKLATPVRFPDCDIEAVSIMAHWLSDEEANTWVKGIEFAKQQVRAAGFKVEGDE